MGYYPRTDISQDDSGLTFELAIPGLSLSDITLELVGNNLVITGTNKERNQHARYSSKELYTGYFTRQYVINPNQFDISTITSKMTNGFLVIKIPFKDVLNINRIKTLTIQEDQSDGSK